MLLRTVCKLVIIGDELARSARTVVPFSKMVVRIVHKSILLVSCRKWLAHDCRTLHAVKKTCRSKGIKRSSHRRVQMHDASAYLIFRRMFFHK